jgi:hypothetical protein
MSGAELAVVIGTIGRNRLRFFDELTIRFTDSYRSRS